MAKDNGDMDRRKLFSVLKLNSGFVGFGYAFHKYLEYKNKYSNDNNINTSTEGDINKSVSNLQLDTQTIQEKIGGASK